jgi:hypothetical protein
MRWHVVSFPPSARKVLRKKGRSDFSPVQMIRAAIRHYTRQPLAVRIQLVREYLASQPDQDSSVELPEHSRLIANDIEEHLGV